MRFWKLWLAGLFVVMALLDFGDFMELAGWRSGMAAGSVPTHFDVALGLLAVSSAAALLAAFALQHRFVAASAMSLWAISRGLAAWYAVELQSYWEQFGLSNDSGYVPVSFVAAGFAVTAAVLIWFPRMLPQALAVAAVGFVVRAAAFQLRRGDNAAFQAHIWILFAGLAVLALVAAAAWQWRFTAAPLVVGLLAAALSVWTAIHVWVTVVDGHEKTAALVVDHVAAGVAVASVLAGTALWLRGLAAQHQDNASTSSG